MCAVLLSFSFVGGESYTIHLNSKLLVDQHIHSKSTVPSLSLANASSSDQISVYFNECGRIGVGRKLTLKDEKETLLKEWRFKNSDEERNSMTCSVKDIQSFKQKGRVKLYYDSEKSTGKLLAIINLNDDVKARK